MVVRYQGRILAADMTAVVLSGELVALVIE
jgi:hypothetical protein